MDARLGERAFGGTEHSHRPPKGVWHKVESHASGCCFFACRGGTQEEYGTLVIEGMILAEFHKDILN